MMGMPDFERVFDELTVDLAITPEEKAHAIGFVEGKYYARKEMAITVIIITAVVGLGMIIAL